MENTSPRAEPVVGHAAFSYPWLNKKTVWGREKTTRQESLIVLASSRFIPAPLVIITTCIFLPSGSVQTAGSLGGSVQLMGETLIVSSFAKLFCLQFARSLSLCLCSLPLPPLLSLSRFPSPHEMNANENYRSHFQIARVHEWAARLPLVAFTVPHRVTVALKITEDGIIASQLSVGLDVWVFRGFSCVF